MDLLKQKARLLGFLYLAGMAAGILSVAPAIDAENYLIEAAANPIQIFIAITFQFMMFLTNLAVAVLFYPILKKFAPTLAVGFLSLRVVSAIFVIFGAILLIPILVLSQEFIRLSPVDSATFETLGNILKSTRDYINHVFMILALCFGNILLYILLFKSKLIPRWLCIWGILGTIFSMFASGLILFQVFEVITTEYLILNVPTAILELVLGIWLIVKGFERDI